MATIRVRYETARQIADHAKTMYPEEACGLLGGTGTHITHAYPVTNMAANAGSNFQLDPNEQLQALKHIDLIGLNWIGVYHSHPRSNPIPSQSDITGSNDPNLIHLIVSLKSNKPKLKAWKISEFEILPLEVLFDTESEQNTAHEPLSNSQKTAIIIASLLSVMLMLAISLSLLPPAPIITPVP